MNHTTRVGRKGWRYHISTPSVLWLFFLPSFMVMAVEISSLAVAWLFGISFLLFLRYCNSQRRIWKPYFFVPIGILLASTMVSYFWFPWTQTWWVLVALFFSAVWIVISIRLLGVEHAYKFCEWLYSARFVGLLSLAYLLVLYLTNSLLPPFDSLLHGWIPSGLLFLIFVCHALRLRYLRRQLPRVTRCPTDAPLLRIAVLQGNRIWLTVLPYTGCCSDDGDNPKYCSDVGALDHPMCACQLPGETVDETLERAKRDSKLNLAETPRHLVKYRCENGQVRHLFVINIKQRWHGALLSLRGRFYSPEEIHQLREKGALNPFLVEEYKYLENTLFLANWIGTK